MSRPPTTDHTAAARLPAPARTRRRAAARGRMPGPAAVRGRPGRAVRVRARAGTPGHAGGRSAGMGWRSIVHRMRRAAKAAQPHRNPLVPRTPGGHPMSTHTRRSTIARLHALLLALLLGCTYALGAPAAQAAQAASPERRTVREHLQCPVRRHVHLSDNSSGSQRRGLRDDQRRGGHVPGERQD